MSTLSMVDVVTAYRKAKSDLYYASDPRRGDVVAYEERLEENLSALLARIQGDNESWVTAPEFIGGFTFAPKKLKEPNSASSTFWSIPSEAWRRETAKASAAAQFRLMAYCSIDFHVLSTVWMLEVGTYLDSLLSESAMGSRLRQSPTGVGPNQLGSGTFQPYQVGYQKWRDGGLQAMTAALDAGTDVVALTADVTSFYHLLDPGFLLNSAFVQEVLHADLSPFQLKLTRIFVGALHSWARAVSDETGWPSRGLPVGLPASAVVANLALADLDRVIHEGVRPLYYGRYVDDVLLVLDAPEGVDDQASLWQWIVERGRGLLTIGPSPFQSDESPEPNAIRFGPPYLADSLVIFENAKNKTFHLSGTSGRAVIDAIGNTIAERNSEWRTLINVPGEVDRIASAITSVRRRDGDAATTLRDADRVSARRLSFSVRLRDFEGFERNLPPDAWCIQRAEFYRVVCEQVMSLPTFFELAKYLPRLITLAAACNDARALTTLFEALAKLPTEVQETCDVRVAAYFDWPDQTSKSAVASYPSPPEDLVLKTWTGYLVDQAVEYMGAGWRGRLEKADFAEVMTPLLPLAAQSGRRLPSAKELQRTHVKFAQRDLAHRPYRWTVLRHPKADRVRPLDRPDVPLNTTLVSGLDLLVTLLRRKPGRSHQALALAGNRHVGLAFGTRPPSAMELYAALPVAREDRYGVADGNWVDKILHATRGYFGGSTVSVEHRRGWPSVVNVAHTGPARPLRVALSMLETDPQDAALAAEGKPNLTVGRLNELRRLLDTVANHRERPDYVLLPELAMPADWFDEFAIALRRSKISLISGIEYQPRGQNGVVNQVWAALRFGGRDIYPHRQDKQRPAKPEIDGLLLPRKKKLTPDHKWRLPPVVAHGDFRFALLICSELTNIAYRSHLRGSIDALLVPEWNRDLHSFESIVDAAALDLHSYVGQANTRGYGDTRLRAPMKDDWDRDVVRLKGGLHDYFVVGHIDVETLRSFHTSGGIKEFEKPQKNLKPLPDGFRIDPQRKIAGS